MTGMFNVYQIYDYIGFNIGDDTVIRNSIFVNRYPANESNLPTRDTRSTNPETVQGRRVVVSLVWQAGHCRSQSLTDPPSRL